MNLGMVVTLVGTAAFKAVCGAGKVLAGFDSQTFPLCKVNSSRVYRLPLAFFFCRILHFITQDCVG